MQHTAQTLQKSQTPQTLEILETLPYHETELTQLCEEIDAIAETFKQTAKHPISYSLKLSAQMHYEVNVRERAPENLQQASTQSLSLTVYHNHCSGSASSSDFSTHALKASFSKAYEIAMHTQADPFSGLPNSHELASAPFKALSLYHPYSAQLSEANETSSNASADHTIEGELLNIAQTMQAYVREQKHIINSEGCGGRYSYNQSILANSLGFRGYKAHSHYSIWANAVAGLENGEGMQTEYWSSEHRRFQGLDDPLLIAKTAVDQAVARLNPRGLRTQKINVVFMHYVADELLEHLLDAISGHAQYHQSGFLTAALGKKIMPDYVEVQEDPWILEGLASCNFDAAGVAVRPQKIIESGCLQTYLLNPYFAKKMALAPTGHAGGTSNLFWYAKSTYAPNTLQDLLKAVHTGLLVTDIMGPGFNEVNGDYSKGVSGFWVEQGEIAYPVEGITIAGNILEMFNNIQAIANDGEVSSIQTGSVWITGMTVAGGI